MISTKVTVKGSGRAYDQFKEVDWVHQVVGLGPGILQDVPLLVRMEWSDDGVKIVEDGQSTSFSWESERPYEFVQLFARHLPLLEVVAVYLETDHSFVGVSLHRGALMAMKFKDDLCLWISDPTNPELAGSRKQEVMEYEAGLLDDVRADMAGCSGSCSLAIPFGQPEEFV